MTTDEKLDELIRLQKQMVEAMQYNNRRLMDLCIAMNILAKETFKNE